MEPKEIFDLIMKAASNVETIASLSEFLSKLANKKEAMTKVESIQAVNEIKSILHDLKREDHYLDYKIKPMSKIVKSTFESDQTFTIPIEGMKFYLYTSEGNDYARVFTLGEFRKKDKIGKTKNLNELTISPRNISILMNKKTHRGKGMMQGQIHLIGHDNTKQRFYLELFAPEEMLLPNSFNIIHLIFTSSKDFAQIITILPKIGHKKNGRIVSGNNDGGSEITDDCLAFENYEQLCDEGKWIEQLNLIGYSNEKSGKIIDSFKNRSINSFDRLEEYLKKIGITVQRMR